MANAMRKTAPAAGTAKSRRSFAKSVGSFVPKLTAKSLEKYGFSAASLVVDWATIAGPQLAQYTVPERLKWPRGVETYSDVDEDARGRPGATLMLRVDPARALDVQYGAAQLLERINRYFGYRAVAEIRILQAPVNSPSAAPKGPAYASPQPSNCEPSQCLEAISDEGLRAALERLEASIRKPK